MPSTTIGRWQYPAALSKAALERLYRLAQTIELVTPPGGAARISFGLALDDAASDELWNGWIAQVSPTPTIAITVAPESGAHLLARGFEQVVERRVRNEPALVVTSWRHD